MINMQVPAEAVRVKDPPPSQSLVLHAWPY
jgi:hypothetical protein